jgi:hypothetical protein
VRRIFTAGLPVAAVLLGLGPHTVDLLHGDHRDDADSCEPGVAMSRSLPASSDKPGARKSPQETPWRVFVPHFFFAAHLGVPSSSLSCRVSFPCVTEVAIMKGVFCEVTHDPVTVTWSPAL